MPQKERAASSVIPLRLVADCRVTLHTARSRVNVTYSAPSNEGNCFRIGRLTIDPSTHTLYAATHGRGIWSLSLSGGKKKK